jgi:uncharacterized membrane protein YqjE
VEPGVDSSTQESPDRARGPSGGLLRSLSHLLATGIGIAQTRIELLSTELQEEVHRVAEIMLWAAVALLAAGVALFLFALAIIFVFWDTHRVAASVGVTGTFVLIAVVAGLVLRAKVRSKPPLLDATRAELAKDRAALLSKR